MRLYATHQCIARLDVGALAEMVALDLSPLYADPDSSAWAEVRRRSEYLGREDRPADVGYRKMRPAGYLQLGVVNLESPTSPWALPMPEALPHERELRAELDRVATVCRDHYGPGLLHLLVLAVLSPGGTVPRHVDMGHNRAWKKFSHHLHVPLIAADGCEFTIADEVFTLETGGVYEIDNMRPHSTRNLSDRHRVNVMIDYCSDQNLPLREAALAAAAASQPDPE
jgi:Aspartyl/Asparaginyl beta-hydroxylase